jgi:hypothetical protein
MGGGFACWAHGAPPPVEDLDLMVKPDDAERALDALVDAGMRGEKPPEQWLLKAWDGEVLIDIIFGPAGLEIDDEMLARGTRMDVLGMRAPVMALEDVFVAKLMALSDHALDYERLLGPARALREKVDWEEVRARAQTPYAAAFFTLLEGLGVISAPRPAGDGGTASRERLRVRPL